MIIMLEEDGTTTLISRLASLHSTMDRVLRETEADMPKRRVVVSLVGDGLIVKGGRSVRRKRVSRDAAALSLSSLL